ncbi:hypothetical protein NP233_g2120 [Leucocoprinus birnbaumii]|uniref:Uncharacterized protein n=1 Tax=Leucocoprinus birnbaumii TaxID=56174 RepID=A0AAD5VYX7_9AGAR|nr:hypothetical protein NP233_g2120 [Leucocoprinus birnbaumii]
MSFVQNSALVIPPSTLNHQSLPVTTRGMVKVLVYMDRDEPPTAYDFPTQHDVLSLRSNPAFMERSGYPLVRYKIFNRTLVTFVGVHSCSLYDVSPKYMRELAGKLFDTLYIAPRAEDSALPPSTPPLPPSTPPLPSSSPLPASASDGESEQTADKLPFMKIQTLNFNFTVNNHNYQRDPETESRKRGGTPNSAHDNRSIADMTVHLDGPARKRVRLDPVGGSIKPSDEVIELLDDEKDQATAKKEKGALRRPKPVCTAFETVAAEIMEISGKEFQNVKNRYNPPCGTDTHETTAPKVTQIKIPCPTRHTVTLKKRWLPKSASHLSPHCQYSSIRLYPQDTDTLSNGVNHQTVAVYKVSWYSGKSSCSIPSESIALQVKNSLSDKTDVAQPGPSYTAVSAHNSPRSSSSDDFQLSSSPSRLQMTETTDSDAASTPSPIQVSDDETDNNTDYISPAQCPKIKWQRILAYVKAGIDPVDINYQLPYQSKVLQFDKVVDFISATSFPWVKQDVYDIFTRKFKPMHTFALFPAAGCHNPFYITKPSEMSVSDCLNPDQHVRILLKSATLLNPLPARDDIISVLFRAEERRLADERQGEGPTPARPVGVGRGPARTRVAEVSDRFQYFLDNLDEADIRPSKKRKRYVV